MPAESGRLPSRVRRAAGPTVVSCAVLLGAGSLMAQGERAPWNARDDVSKIGSDRGVGKGFNLYSLEAEQKLGLKLATQIEKRYSVLDDPVVSEYVNRIAQNLARNSDARIPITAKVIKSNAVNAFALPGGHFYVSTGLIRLAGDEAELAGVMGHEIAHITARHGTRAASRGEVASLAGGILGALGGRKAELATQVASLAVPMAFLKFSREFEKQSDILGVQYLYAAGYDPLGMVQFFERLSALQQRSKHSVPAVFSSHPLTKKRIRLVQQAINELLPDQPSYNLTSSEFEAVKARIESLP